MFFNVLKLLITDYLWIIALIFNFILLFILIKLYNSVKNEKKRWNRINDYLGDITKTVNSVRYGDLTKKINNFDIPDSENLTDSLNRMIETLHD